MNAPDRLEDIKRRLADETRYVFDEQISYSDALWMIGEVERLRAELAQTHARVAAERTGGESR